MTPSLAHAQGHVLQLQIAKCPFSSIFFFSCTARREPTHLLLFSFTIRVIAPATCLPSRQVAETKIGLEFYCPYFVTLLWLGLGLELCWIVTPSLTHVQGHTLQLQIAKCPFSSIFFFSRTAQHESTHLLLFSFIIRNFETLCACIVFVIHSPLTSACHLLFRCVNHRVCYYFRSPFAILRCISP